MGDDLAVNVGGLPLKNPVMAGSGEATMTAEGLRAAVDAGAGAVVAKSTNESTAARRQLDVAEYVLLDEHWERLPWGPAPRSASLFCRSGLVGESLERWLEVLVAADAYAARADSYVVASLIVADLEQAAVLARRVESAGLRWIELNVGPPYRGETSPGAIRSECEPDVVSAMVAAVRAAVSLPLTVKLSSQGDPLAAATAAVGAGADAVCLTGRYPAFMPDIATRRPMLGTFGAIGGAWSLPLSLRWIAKARAALGPKVSLLGTNGARDGLDVVRFLLSGASAVEMTSAVITDGPGVLTSAVEQVAAYLGDHAVRARDIIGEAADQATSIAALTDD